MSTAIQLYTSRSFPELHTCICTVISSMTLLVCLFIILITFFTRFIGQQLGMDTYMYHHLLCEGYYFLNIIFVKKIGSQCSTAIIMIIYLVQCNLGMPISMFWRNSFQPVIIVLSISHCPFHIPSPFFK